MERFVRLVVGGGLALVAGLWVVRLTAAWSSAWTVGLGLALIGAGAVLAGIRIELDVDR